MEVSGLGGGDRHADGFQITHLTDQDNIGIFTQYIEETCASSGASPISR